MTACRGMKKSYAVSKINGFAEANISFQGMIYYLLATSVISASIYYINSLLLRSNYGFIITHHTAAAFWRSLFSV